MDSWRLKNLSDPSGRSLHIFLVVFLSLFVASYSAAQAQGTWASKAPAPTQRTGNAVVAINSNVYSVGGRISSTLCTPLANLETYAATTNTWSISPPMPTARFNTSAANLNGKLYVAGGQTDCNTAIATLEMYDPVLNTWSTKSPMPTARWSLGLGVLNGTLYAMGGSDSAGNVLNTVEAYNPTTDSWIPIAPMPTPRAGLAVGVIGGTLYAVGGFDGTGTPIAVSESYSVANQWSTVSSMPTPRGYLVVGAINGIMYAAGGLGGAGTPLATLEAYNPITDTWASSTSMLGARYGSSGAGVANGSLYVIGGLNAVNIAVATNEAFKPPYGPKFVYALNNANPFGGSTQIQGFSYLYPAIAGYTVDYNTGFLTPILGSPFSAGAPTTFLGTPAMAVDPLGRFVYFLTNTDYSLDGTTGFDGIVSVFTVDPTLGVLKLVGGSPFKAGLVEASQIAADPTGKYIYVIGACVTLGDCINNPPDAIAVLSVDPKKGTLSQVGTFNIAAQPLGAVGMDIDPNDKFVYVANQQDQGMDKSTGSVSVLAVDPESGALLPGSTFSSISGLVPSGVSADPGGQFIYVTTNNCPCGPTDNGIFVDGGVEVLTVDQESGSLSIAPGSPYDSEGSQTSAAAGDPNGQFVYAANMVNGNDLTGRGYSGSVAMYSLEAMTGGGLESVGFSPFALEAFLLNPGAYNTNSIAADPSGRFVYVASNDIPAFPGIFGELAGSGSVNVLAVDASNELLSPVVASTGGAGLGWLFPTGAVFGAGSVGAIGAVTDPNATLQSISVQPTSSSASTLIPQQFTAVGHYSDGSLRYLTESVAWTVSDPTVATVGNGSSGNLYATLVTLGSGTNIRSYYNVFISGGAGVATGIKGGSAQVIATYGGISGSASLTSTDVVLHSIAVTPADPTIVAGTSQQFTATGMYSDGSTQNLTASATWISATSAVATIGSSGKAKGVKAGTTNIEAFAGGMEGQTTLTVTPAELVSIRLTPTNPTIPNPGTVTFLAIGTYTDSTVKDITSSVTWTSETTSVATITGAGVASAVSPGTSTISAALDGVTATATLTVTGAQLVSLAVTPANTNVLINRVRQFSASGTFNDSTTSDLTQSVTWSTGSSSVATIGTLGLATGVGLGTTSVTATLNGVTGSESITTQAFVPKYAYAINGGDFTISAYSVDSISGLLTPVPGSPFAAGVIEPFGISLDPQGRFVYVVSGSVGLVSALSVNPATGALTPAPGSPFSTGAGAAGGVAADPLGRFVYAVSNPAGAGDGVVAVFSLNTTTGTLTQVAGSPFDSGGSGSISVTADPTGQFLYVTNVQSNTISGFSVNATTGALTSIPGLPLASQGIDPIYESMDPTGRFLYVLNNNSQNIAAFAVNATTGALTTVGGSPFSISVGSAVNLSVDPGGSFLYTSGCADSTCADGAISVFPLNATTGALSPVVGPPIDSGGAAVAGEASGKFVYAVNGCATSACITGNIFVLSLNGSSGTLTMVPGSPFPAGGSPAAIATFGAAADPNATLVSLAVTPTTATLTGDFATQQFTVSGTYSDGTTRFLTASATWSSSDATVATVSNVAGTAGIVTAVKQGTATITATMGSVSGSAILTVLPPTLLGISIAPFNPSVPIGLTLQFTATGTYSDGSQQDLTNSVTWSSDYCTITSGGLASGVSIGSCAITAALGSLQGSTTLNITAAVITSITVTPVNPAIASGTTLPFVATGTYSDGTQNVAPGVAWSSATTSVATITAGGLATGVGPGSSIITASLGSVTGNTTLTVTSSQLSSLVLSPASVTLAANGVRQFNSTGMFNDGTTQNLTQSVTWSTGATGVATINSGGLATGVAAGNTTVTATFGAVSASSSLTVTRAFAPSFSYAANDNDNTISEFSVNASTGTLTQVPGSPIPFGFALTLVAADPLGRFVYAVGICNLNDCGSGSLGVFSVDSTTGLLTQVPGSPFALAGQYPDSIITDPSGQFVYVASQCLVGDCSQGSVAAFSVNATTGALTPVAGSPYSSGGVTALSVSADPNGKFLYVGNGCADSSCAGGSIAVFSVNAPTGALTPVSGSPFATATTVVSSASADPAGRFVYAVTSCALNDCTTRGVAVFSVDGSSGALKSTPGSPFSTQSVFSSSMGVDPGGQFIYLPNLCKPNYDCSGGTVTVLSVNGSTGALAQVAGSPFDSEGQDASSASPDPSGRYLYVANECNPSASYCNTGSVATFSVNAGTGALTPVPGSPFNAGNTPSFAAGLAATWDPTATLQSLSVQPQSASILPSATQQFVAMASYSDGSARGSTASAAWSSSDTTLAAVSNSAGSSGLATGVAAGTATITATVGTVSGTASLVIASQAGQTITVTVPAPATAIYKSSFTIGASASSGLLISFASSGACTNTGATFTIDATKGTCTVTMNQAGNSSFLPAPQIQETTTVAKAITTATVVTTSGSPSFINVPVTFTSTTTPASGQIPDGETITFLDGATVIGTGVTASGVATFSTSLLKAKTHTIKAKFAGDTTFSTGTSPALSQVIELYPGTVTLTTSPNPSAFGQSVEMIATVTSGAPDGPTGTVTFKNGSTSLGAATLSGGTALKATTSLPLGSDTLSATYNGDAQNAKSTSASSTQNVNQAVVSMTLTSSLNPSKSGKSVKFTATLTSSGSLPTGTVMFSSNGTALGTATIGGGKASFSTTALPGGSDQVTATFGGNADDSAASASITQTVD